MFGRSMRDWYDPFDYTNDIFPEPDDEPVIEPRVHLLNVIEPRRHTGAVTEPKKDDKYFKVMLNVKHFRPDEIEVKTVDNFLVIHGKHEEKADRHGYASREFTRRYQLPDNVDHQTIKASLGGEDILIIFAQMKALEPPPNERVVPITRRYYGVEGAEERQETQEQQATQQGSEEQKPLDVNPGAIKVLYMDY